MLVLSFFFGMALVVIVQVVGSQLALSLSRLQLLWRALWRIGVVPVNSVQVAIVFRFCVLSRILVSPDCVDIHCSNCNRLSCMAWSFDSVEAEASPSSDVKFPVMCPCIFSFLTECICVVYAYVYFVGPCIFWSLTCILYISRRRPYLSFFDDNLVIMLGGCSAKGPAFDSGFRLLLHHLGASPCFRCLLVACCKHLLSVSNV